MHFDIHAEWRTLSYKTCLDTKPVLYQDRFLPEASFGLQILSLPASLCVCLSVCLSVNHEFVHAITHRPFELESPNLAHRCKTPWLRSLSIWGAIDLDLQCEIKLESWILPHSELVQMKVSFQARVTKFRPKMHLSRVKIPTDLGVDRPWSSGSNAT